MTLRKFIPAGLALGALPCFAEGTATTVSGAVSQLQTSATDAVNAVAPAVLAVITALFVIVGILFAYRKIKSALGR